MRRITMLLAALSFVAGAPQITIAGIGDSAAGLTYTVPGVINSGTLATVFQCTNTNPSSTGAGGSILFGVDVFRGDGTLAGSTAIAVPPGGTALIATQPVGSLLTDAIIGIGTNVFGSARITGSKKLICSAYALSPGTTPAYINTLPVIAKYKQKGQ